MKSILLPVLFFTLSMTITPGPNNLLLTATGARFGFRKTLPLILGILLGLQSLLLFSALGLGTLFQLYPAVKKALQILGCLYILYLAVRIALPGKKNKKSDTSDKAPGLFQGVVLQYLNPKAYIMTITSMAVYTLDGEDYLRSALLIMACFLIITPLSISLWAAFGSILKQWMNQERRRKLFNFILGGITAFSVVFIIH